MKNFTQEGDIITLTPAAAVASGVGYLFGVSLFGVAVGDVANGTPGEFKTRGVIEIAKTNALAINTGDRVFWDPVNKCVNKTAAAQQCVGIAIADAANPSATVTIRLGAVPAVGA